MAYDALRNTPVKNPKKEPIAARNAFFTGAFVYNSPRKEPKNGPKIIPKGPAKSPTIKPNMAPLLPALLPPNHLLPKTGIT